MDTRWIEDVLVLLDEGNLSRAAARRNVTQPAFSRRIKAFEHWIGKPLLTREANRVVLHPSLAAHEEDLRALLQRLGELRSLIARREPGAPHLTVVSQHALSVGAFPEVCGAFLAKRADLTLRLRTLNWAECVSLFLREEADILLTYKMQDFPPAAFEKDITTTVWRADSLVPAISRKLFLELGGADGLPADVPIIAYPDDSHFGRLTAKAQAAGMKPLQHGPRRVTSAFSLGVLQLIRAGIGIGWVPRSLAEHQTSGHEVTILDDLYGAVSVDVTLYALSANTPATELLKTVQTPSERGDGIKWGRSQCPALSPLPKRL